MPLSLQTVSTVGEAQAAVAAGGARYLGGGTLAVRAANEGDLSFTTLVRSHDPRLTRLDVANGRAWIGASVTMAAIARHPGLSPIAQAARAVGGPAIRNMATIGGNLFAPTPYGDFAVALLALNATVDLDEGSMPIDELLHRRETFDRVVVGVEFDVPREGAFRLLKVSRVKPKGISVLSIAACIETGDDGVVTRASIGLGCMADRPLRARAAEAALVGTSLKPDGIAPALAAITEAIEPPTDAIASAWYRREVLPVHFRRLLTS